MGIPTINKVTAISGIMMFRIPFVGFFMSMRNYQVTIININSLAKSRYSIFFLISGFKLPFFFSFFGWHVQKQLSCLKSWLFLYVHSLVCIISDLSDIMKIHDKVRWMIIWAIIVNAIIEPMSFFLLILSQIMLDSKHIQNNSQYW